MSRLEARYVPPGGGPPVVLWVRALPAGVDLFLGRDDAPAASPAGWGVAVPAVPADLPLYVSTRHLTVRWDGERLHARRRVPPPPNPVRRLASGDEPPDPFTVRVGEGVAIGKFEFRVLAPPSSLEISLGVPFAVKAPARPGGPNALAAVIRKMIDLYKLTADDEAFAETVVRALLDAIPAAGGAALVAVPESPDADPAAIRTKARDGGPVRFSRTEARHAATEGTGWFSPKTRVGGPDPTFIHEIDWGVYVPVEAAPGEWRLVAYACGRAEGGFDRPADLTAHPDLAGAIEAAQLVTEVYSVLRRLRRQQAENEHLMQFLPQPVRVLSDRGPLGPALEPRVVKVTALFCDIRGSCGLAESGAADLEKYWWQVLHEALHQMADAVVEHGGVIGSFLGDAVMAFWGWPHSQDAPNGDDDQAARAVKAASRVWKQFDRTRAGGGPTAGLWFGIGIAHGLAFAGKLGTRDQWKVDVIGPTINLAARLEGLTKVFGVPVLLDAAAAARLPDDMQRRTRRIGRVLPYGITEPTDLHAAHTRLDEPVPVVTRGVARRYEDALASFERGDWAAARDKLHAIREADTPAGFLWSLIGAASAPPADWPHDADGRCLIRMTAK